MGAELLRKICGVGSSQGLVFKSSEVGQSISIKGRMESSLRTLIRKKSTGTETVKLLANDTRLRALSIFTAFQNRNPLFDLWEEAGLRRSRLGEQRL